MPIDALNYDQMVDHAMRGVVRDALAQCAESGLPGEHHFYVSFRTDAPGVDMPASLRAQYPDEMTIVIQHQFWGLSVEPERFSVELAFGGKRARLTVPLAALTGFADPHAKFGLKFGAEPAAANVSAIPEGSGGNKAPLAAEPGAGGGDKVVTLDSFRKK